MLDLAIGIIIGASFGKIVSSLVNDILMPVFGVLLGQLNISSLALTIGKVSITYGLFLQSILDFVIVAFCIFLFVKQVNRFKKSAPPPVAMKEEVQLLTEIRDSLRTKNV